MYFKRYLKNMISRWTRHLVRTIIMDLALIFQRCFKIGATNEMLLDFSRIFCSTPTFHKTSAVPVRVKSTFSSIKRLNRRSIDNSFEGRARRELFQSSPIKFLMETDRICKLPKKHKSKKEYSMNNQRRLRI
ncbi:unnamed protein product [Nezara viridula]|uniref:Uncharacterized protein n=1 Tax=Nezara viridula TaxID=85310 RepID=A0A9P0MQ27_NEZVI|nr:unnamed protein product [Nezara viridula]